MIGWTYSYKEETSHKIDEIIVKIMKNVMKRVFILLAK